MTTSCAHKGDWMLQSPFKLGLEYGDDGTVPFEAREGKQHCAFCGSLHPTEVVALLKAGAAIHFADWKYGWPHKAYLDNPWGKFYTRHLVDATPEEYEYISRRLGLYITYDPDTQTASWQPWYPKA